VKSASVFRILRALLAAAALSSLAGCGGESAREDGLEWKLAPLAVFERVDAPSAERLRAEGFPVAGAAPTRLLKVAPADGLDTLSLLEFPRDAAAYLVFQELASHPGDFAEGFSEVGERVYFRRGRWIGAMHAESWNGPGALESDLSLPGSPAGSAPLPREFSSLLRQKRFEGTERILVREFAGVSLPAVVYAAQYDCRGDSAWIYASAGLDRAFGLALARAPGWKADSSGEDLEVFALPPAPTPFRLRFSGRGMAGVEGCFDSDLTRFWLKMQSRGLKSLK
jgi:hypothetical protein